MPDIIQARFSNPEEELENLFSEMSEGYKVQIKRIEPEWCNGILGTFEFDPHEPISTDWVKKRFGGRKLTIRVLKPDNSYVGGRTITFPVSPKDDGFDIVPGPNGSPVLASQANVVPEQQRQDLSFSGALEQMFKAQIAQANQMQGFLLQRVSSLEDILTRRLEAPQTAQLSGIPQPYDPNASLKTTLETMRMIEELKQNVTGGITEEPDAMNPFFGQVLEKIIDKLAGQATPPAPSFGAVPPLPAARSEISDMDLARLAKERFKRMNQEERDVLMNYVMSGEEEWDYEEDEIECGQVTHSGLTSLLSREDQEELDTATPTNESPKN